MKKMNNKGFLLAESLVASTFVLTVLVLLFVQFKTLFNSYEDSYDYNTVEGIYNLNTMKKFITQNETTPLKNQMTAGYKIVAKDNRCTVDTGIANLPFCDELVSKMGLKTLLYTNSNLSSLNTSNAIFTESFKQFIKRIKNENNKNRLIGQFNDGTYATIVYEK